MAAPYRADFDANEEYSGLRRPNLPVGNMTTQLPVYSGGFDVTAYQQQQMAQAQAQAIQQQQQQLQQQLQAQQQQQAQQIASSLRADAAPFVMPIKDHTLSSNGWHNDLQQQQQQYNNSYQQVQLQPHLNGYMPQPQQQQQQQNFTPPIANLYQRQRGMHQQMNALSSNLENRLNIGQQQQQQSTRNTPGGTYFQDNAHTNYANNFNNSNMSNRYHHQTYYNQQQQQNQQAHQQHQQPHHHQHQNRDKYHYNAGTSKNTKYNNASGAASASSAASVNDPANVDGNTEEESAALSYLQQVVQCLNENPGKFYSIATRFLTIFEGMEENSKVLSIAMEEIFQMSIQTPNFRYMGAKLYNLLYALNPKSDSLFNRLLKFKLDYHQKEVCEYMEKNQDNLVRETALFLAELYMQLRGDGRLTLIGENIVFSLKQLLKRETMDNLRCICLTLKLAGFDLSADCAQEMKDIIASLEAINAASPGKYAIVENVLSLQKNNWGRKTSISEVLPPMPVRMSDEPVFYGPDGTELTAEEAEFIKGVLPDDDDDDNDDDLDFDPEMDEETEKDYKEFLKLNASKS